MNVTGRYKIPFLGNIRVRLIISTFVIVFFILATMYLFKTNITKNFCISEQNKYVANCIDQIGLYYNNYFKNIEVTLDKISGNTKIKSALTMDPSKMSSSGIIALMNDINTELSDSITSKNLISNIILFGSNKLNFTFENALSSPFSELPNFYELMEDSFIEKSISLESGSILYYSGDERTNGLEKRLNGIYNIIKNNFYYIRVVKNKNNIPMGVVLLTLNNKVFSRTISNLPYSGQTYVSSKKDDILWSNASNNNEIDSKTVADLLQSLSFESTANYKLKKINSEEYLIDYSYIANNNLKVINIINLRDLVRKFDSPSRLILVFSLFYILFVFLISAIFSKVITRSIHNLSSSLLNLQTNDSKIGNLPIMKFNKFFTRFSLKGKIFLYFITTIIVPSIIFTFLAIYSYYYAIKDYIVTYTSNTAAFANINLNYYLSGTETLINSLIYSTPVQELIVNNDRDTSSLIQKLILDNKMSKKELLSISIYNSSLDCIFSTIYSNDRYPEKTGSLLKVHEKAMGLSGLTYIQSGIDPYMNPVITFAKKIYNSIEPDASRNIGFITVDIDVNSITGIFQNTIPGSSSFFNVLDTSGNNILNTSFSKKNPIEKMNFILKNKSGNFYFNEPTGKYLAVFDTCQLTGWKIVGSIPNGTLIGPAMKIIYYGIAMLLLNILLILFVSYAFSAGLIRGTHKLQKLMEEIEAGNTNVRMDYRKKDEIYVLANSFNIMVENLNRLIDEVYKSKLKEQELMFLEKEAQLNALQQQINPHFLYNTLESIKWIAYKKGIAEICEMTNALGKFFKGSITMGREFVTINDEIEHVKTYLIIQQLRYKDKFIVNWDISSEILECKIPKLAIQPLVENSIIHGVDNMKTGGVITISCNMDENTVNLSVSDNGVGMSKNQLEDIISHLDNNERSQKHGIGLNNVHQRFKLYFGWKYKFSIESAPKGGTRITISYPVSL